MSYSIEVCYVDSEGASYLIDSIDKPSVEFGQLFDSFVESLPEDLHNNVITQVDSTLYSSWSISDLSDLANFNLIEDAWFIFSQQ